MEEKIKNFIKKHYPSVKININGVGEDNIHIEYVSKPKCDVKFMYGRLFKQFEWLEYIIVEGGWDSWVYTKNTLKYAGYYND